MISDCTLVSLMIWLLSRIADMVDRLGELKYALCESQGNWSSLSGLPQKSDWVTVLWVGLWSDKNCGFELVSHRTQLISCGSCLFTFNAVCQSSFMVWSYYGCSFRWWERECLEGGDMCCWYLSSLAKVEGRRGVCSSSLHKCASLSCWHQTRST